MSRYRTMGRRDEERLVDGDSGFIGVDERDPSQVPPGFCSKGENLTFRNRVAEPRLGIEALPWLNDSSSHAWLTPLASGVLAGAVFNDPDDQEWVMVATPTQVYAVRESATPVLVPLPSPSVTLGEVSFTQAMNKLIMFRGPNYPVLELQSVSEGFGSIAQEDNTETGGESNNPNDGTESIPQGSSGIWMQNRLFVPHSRDLIAASDYLNYTRYSPTRADFRINQGSADELVALYKFGDTGLIAFKEQTIHQVANVQGDLSIIRQEVLSTEFGLVARKAIASDGADPWFLSQRGVTSIGQILDNKARTAKETWSDPMIETMKRVNWQHAHKATATYFDGNFYLALPLDAAQVTNNAGTFSGVNNAILIFDNQNQAWAGTWTGASVMVKDWLQFTWAGKRRLGFLSEDGMILMINHAFDDWVRADGGGLGLTRAEIRTRFRSRGFSFVPNDSSPEIRRSASSTVKRFTRANVVLNTWNPKYSIRTRVDGANETTAVTTDETRDRTRWVRPFDRAPWDTTNANGDDGDPGREDYSVDTSGLGCNCDAGGGEGINFEQHQECPVVKRVNAQGRYCQMEVDGDQGRVEVKAIEMEGRAGSRRNGLLV